jgi:hypothetical protein
MTPPTSFRTLRVFVAALLVGLFVAPAAAQWAPGGTAVTTAINTQDLSRMISDGAGGAIVTWRDRRNEITGDIYAQRLDPLGNMMWTPGGAPVCTVLIQQTTPDLTTDGAGGAIVVWADIRTGNKHNIYVQRMSASGEPLWTPGGVAICTADREQTDPKIVSDGLGGAIICWTDGRNAMHDDIYAQRVDALGTPLWTTDGVLVCGAITEQFEPEISSDGAAGAIIVWMDYRNPPQYDLYAQRVDDSGAPVWAPDGIGVATTSSTERYQQIVADGAGGAIITWSVDGDGDVLAQRFNSAGDTLWTPEGVVVCTYPSSQRYPQLCADDGGAIVTWADDRSDDGDIYAQRIGASGALLWSTDGNPVCTADNNQSEVRVIYDGTGGAIFCWRDLRSYTASWDIYAQHLNPSGAAVWASDGVPLCYAPNYQWTPLAVPDGAGGAIVTWRDLRSGDWDIYAQHVDAIATSVPGRVPATSTLTLYPCAPNPFAGGTSLRFQLGDASVVRMEIFDVAGRRVHAQTFGRFEAGLHGIFYDGRDANGRTLPSGVYIYRIQTPGAVAKGKMVIRR